MRSMLRVRKDQGCPEFPPGGFDLPLLRCLSPKFAFALILDSLDNMIRLHMSFCSSCYLSAGLLNLCNHVHHKSCKQVACVSWTHHAYYRSPKKKQIQRVSSTNIAIRLHVWVRPTADITGTTSADWFALRSSQQAKIQMVAGSTIGVTGKTSAIFPRCILSQENFCTG